MKTIIESNEIETNIIMPSDTINGNVVEWDLLSRGRFICIVDGYTIVKLNDDSVVLCDIDFNQNISNDIELDVVDGDIKLNLPTMYLSIVDADNVNLSTLNWLTVVSPSGFVVELIKTGCTLGFNEVIAVFKPYLPVAEGSLSVVDITDDVRSFEELESLIMVNNNNTSVVWPVFEYDIRQYLRVCDRDPQVDARLTIKI